jgi:hypothetical protein
MWISSFEPLPRPLQEGQKFEFLTIIFQYLNPIPFEVHLIGKERKDFPEIIQNANMPRNVNAHDFNDFCKAFPSQFCSNVCCMAAELRKTHLKEDTL